MKYEQKVIEVMKLETKDIVELRNGSFCLVVGDMLMGETGYLQVKYYTEDLRYDGNYNTNAPYDIMRVYSTISWGYGTNILNILKERVKKNDLKFSGFKVLWERNEGDEDGNC